MYSRLHCQLSESLPLKGCGTFIIPAAHLQVQEVILRTHTLEHDFSSVIGVFFYPLGVVNPKKLAFAYSLLLSQSASSPFDLSFV